MREQRGSAPSPARVCAAAAGRRQYRRSGSDRQPVAQNRQCTAAPWFSRNRKGLSAPAPHRVQWSMTAVLRPRCRGMKRSSRGDPEVPASDGEEVTVVFINIKHSLSVTLCQRAMSADSDTATSSQFGSQLFTPSSAAFAALKLASSGVTSLRYRQAPGARADAGLRRFIQQEIDRFCRFRCSVRSVPTRWCRAAPARHARLYHPPARKF